MRFSIITATKNNKAGVLRAIECVLSQTYKNIEHIIVDGGSTDGTVELLNQIQNDKKSTVIPAKEVSRESTSDSGTESGMTNKGNRSLFTDHYSLLTISEADSGIYDAINKGIKLATGDVIGLLHSDDLFANKNVLEKYASAFDQPFGSAQGDGKAGMKDLNSPADSSSSPQNDNTNVVSGMTGRIDAIYSDLVYVKSVNSEQIIVNRKTAAHDSILTNNYSPITNYSIIRYWKTHKSVDGNQILRQAQDDIENYSPVTDHYSLKTDNLLKKGWMPPHPTLFIRKKIFEHHGLYRTDMKIAADYEMILRLFLKHNITCYYLPVTTYLMTLGGASNKSLKNIFKKSKEDLRAMELNGISFPYYTLALKNLRKIPQFLVRSL